MVALAGCSSAAPIAETTTTTSTTIPVVTSIEYVPAEILASAGTITVADTRYELSFECFAAGAGDVLALGVGLDPETSEPVEAVVQAFLGDPYVAVRDEDGVSELALDREAVLFVQSGSIVGSALRFVRGDESPGVGDDLGFGEVDISCGDFQLGLPDGYGPPNTEGEEN